MSKEMNENFDEETVVVEEETKESFVAKAKAGIKKHGKKIAAVAVVGTVGLIGYALGSRNNTSVDSDTVSEIIDDVISEGIEVTEN